MKARQIIRALLLSALLGAAPALAQHAGDMWVGRSAAGQLKLDLDCLNGCGFDPAANVTVLAVDPYGGYSSDSPGFDRITADSPGEDLYMLEAGASVRLQLLGDPEPPVALADVLISPTLYVYDPVTFYLYPYESGGTIYREVALGDENLHKHVNWFIDSYDPAFDPAACVWELTARLIDVGSTNYAPSEPFTLRFSLHELVPGDFDCDRDVDEADLMFFEACHAGPALPLSVDCEKADLDGDADADTADFGILQRCWTGDGTFGDPACK